MVLNGCVILHGVNVLSLVNILPIDGHPGCFQSFATTVQQDYVCFGEHVGGFHQSEVLDLRLWMLKNLWYRQVTFQRLAILYSYHQHECLVPSASCEGEMNVKLWSLPITREGKSLFITCVTQIHFPNSREGYSMKFLHFYVVSYSLLFQDFVSCLERLFIFHIFSMYFYFYGLLKKRISDMQAGIMDTCTQSTQALLRGEALPALPPPSLLPPLLPPGANHYPTRRFPSLWLVSASCYWSVCYYSTQRWGAGSQT